MASDKPVFVVRSSPDGLAQTAKEVPAAVVDSIFKEEWEERGLPRAVTVGTRDVAIYLACKRVSTETLREMEKLAERVVNLEEIEGLNGKPLRKVIVAVQCDQGLRQEAEQSGIHVLTKDELVLRRSGSICASVRTG
jgi:hypothetical protein